MFSYFNQVSASSSPKQYVEVCYRRHEKKDQTIYESVVPFTLPCGLIRITGNSDKVNITFTDENEFKVVCQVDNCMIQDQWERQACYPMGPYWFDTEMKLKTLQEKSDVPDEIRTITCQQGVRGGNRLSIDLRNLKSYFNNKSFTQSNTISHSLFIPKDCDVDVNAKIKVLNLETRKCTLNVECNDVSHIGDCGSSGPEGQSWSYYEYASSSDNVPDTIIKTNGYVDLDNSQDISCHGQNGSELKVD